MLPPRTLVLAGLTIALALSFLPLVGAQDGGPEHGEEGGGHDHDFCLLFPSGSRAPFYLREIDSHEHGEAFSFSLFRTLEGDETTETFDFGVHPETRNASIADSAEWRAQVRLTAQWFPGVPSPEGVVADEALEITATAILAGRIYSTATDLLPGNGEIPVAEFDLPAGPGFHGQQHTLDEVALWFTFSLGEKAGVDPLLVPGEMVVKVATSSSSTSLTVPGDCDTGTVHAASVHDETHVHDAPPESGPIPGPSNAQPPWGPAVVTAGAGIAGLSLFRGRPRA